MLSLEREALMTAGQTQPHKCASCGKRASMRVIDDVIDGYWTEIRLALSAECDKLLRLCDQRAWEWFHEYAFKNSK